MTKPVRFKPEDLKILEQLKNSSAVKEMAVDQGIIDDFHSRFTWEALFLLIIPEGDEPIAYPEDEMTWQDAGDARDRIVDLAGENVPVHEVISTYTMQFAEENDLEVEV